MMSLRSLISSLLPARFKQYVGKVLVRIKMRSMQARYPNVIERLRHKEQIKVAFMLINASVWKLDELFRLMLQDERFDPILVLCPLTAFDDPKHQERELLLLEQLAKQNNYPYIHTKQTDGTWLDVRNELKPDVVFFTTPYPYNTLSEYYVLNFPDSLNCYVTYSSMNFWNLDWDLNQPFHNYIWRYFAENDLIQSYMEKAGDFRGKNCFVSGFPAFDCYLNKDYRPKHCWRNSQQIKIIWAPHHTIDDCKVLQYSNFLEMADPMVELAKKYAAQVQFAFKPHPMLRPKLEQIWGKERTKQYYDFWSNSPNTQFEAGAYVDLFYTSDAMIFDSSSFITEYLYADKRSVFVNKANTANMLNEFGLQALNCHGEVNTMEQVEQFISSLVGGTPDALAPKREEFYKRYIAPYNTPSPSHNIITHICNTCRA